MMMNEKRIHDKVKNFSTKKLQSKHQLNEELGPTCSANFFFLLLYVLKNVFR